MHYLRTRALFAFGLMRGWHVGMWNYEDMKSRISTPTFGIWRGSGAESVSCPNCGLRYIHSCRWVVPVSMLTTNRYW